jgi:SAM-dependent methyltransferase
MYIEVASGWLCHFLEMESSPKLYDCFGKQCKPFLKRASHPPQMMCPICQSKVEPVGLGKATLGGNSQFDVVECQSCATRYLSPLPTGEQLEGLYWPYSYGSDWYKQLGLGTAFAKLVLGKQKPGKFLDVGCGLGFFIDGIRKHSKWEVYGVEITAGATEFARDRLGLDVRQGQLVEIRYPDSFFDYIRLCNVLEHVTDPMTLLRECRRILKPEGVVLLRVPNGLVDTLDLLNFYRSNGNPPFSKSGHVFFFPKQTLLHMFEEVGLNIARSRTYGIRRGLARLGFWPRFKDWRRHYVSEPHRETDHSTPIALVPGKHRPDLYYTYRMIQMTLRMLPGMREFGLDYELLLRPQRSRDTPERSGLSDSR